MNELEKQALEEFKKQRQKIIKLYSRYSDLIHSKAINHTLDGLSAIEQYIEHKTLPFKEHT